MDRKEEQKKPYDIISQMINDPSTCMKYHEFVRFVSRVYPYNSLDNNNNNSGSNNKNFVLWWSETLLRVLYDTAATIVIKKYVSHYTREQVYLLKWWTGGSENNSIISVNVEKETYNIMIYAYYRRRAPPKETNDYIRPARPRDAMKTST